MVIHLMKQKRSLHIIPFLIAFGLFSPRLQAQSEKLQISMALFQQPLQLVYVQEAAPEKNVQMLSEQSIHAFLQSVNIADNAALFPSLLKYKKENQLDDWLYYQLIRNVVQQISPKEKNYYAYTLYKWYFLNQSGYDATVGFSGSTLLLYVQSNENVFNIPSYKKDGKQYFCLNYHDYGNQIDFDKNSFTEIRVASLGAEKPFSFKIIKLPEFGQETYSEKEVGFSYNDCSYQFKIKLNPQLKLLFKNYPVVDYESYFNIPLSKQTYQSLIPILKTKIKGLSEKQGINFIMQFTRYAFLFQPDKAQFGGEKRLSAEQTLLYEQSDCEDRAALFFYLVKEIYNLPMLLLSYPEHVTVAIKFNKANGTPIMYKGEKYYICEPTPQREDLALGQIMPSLKNAAYEIAYVYTPEK